MTLCFFSAQYLPTVGGVERYTFNLAKRVIAAGHKALVVTSALPGLPMDETDEYGIQIIRLPVWPLMNGRFPVLKPGRQLAEQLKKVWAQKPDFCLINTRFYISSLYAARAAKKRGVPAIIVDHSTGHLPMGSAIMNFAGQCYEHFACWFIRLYCPRFYGVSQAVCRWLEHFHVKPEGTLYNAVDPAELESILANAPKRDWRAELGLSEKDRLIAFVGRIIPEKGA
ncbi:MAG: glycosyltransferase family 4 protein, partial [Oscillospiraceae bacterium]|nr:glycosyltransferase family 4 protein [Oscillospiraceae bacterium]